MLVGVSGQGLAGGAEGDRGAGKEQLGGSMRVEPCEWTDGYEAQSASM